MQLDAIPDKNKFLLTLNHNELHAILAMANSVILHGENYVSESIANLLLLAEPYIDDKQLDEIEAVIQVFDNVANDPIVEISTRRAIVAINYQHSPEEML